MANEEQLAILRQGVEVWNKWKGKKLMREVDLSRAELSGAALFGANLSLSKLSEADLSEADLSLANLTRADLSQADLSQANLSRTNLFGANLNVANLNVANLSAANLSEATAGTTLFSNVDLGLVRGLSEMRHFGPSSVDTHTLQRSQGKIPEIFLKGCGLSDWEIEMAKLYNPDLSNEERNKILYKVYDLQASQAIQISPLFISYSHGDSEFVNKIEKSLTQKGIRFWRDIHDMKAGRIETQIDQAISQNRTVLLVLSENSTKSDWVEHEVRTARGLEKDMGHDVLCPIALDNSWKSSPWPKRVMEQIMEYNILDFSAWEDDSKFDSMFRKLIDGLELFYKDKSHGE